MYKRQPQAGAPSAAGITYSADPGNGVSAGMQENVLDVVYEAVAGLCCPGLTIGLKVIPTDLQKAASLNGAQGQIVGHDAGKSRYGVQLTEDSRRLSVKSRNLLVSCGHWVPVAVVVATVASIISEENALAALENWESLGVMLLCQQRVRFCVPFFHISAATDP